MGELVNDVMRLFEGIEEGGGRRRW